MPYDHHQVRSLLKDSLTAEASDIIFKVPGRPMFRSGDRLVPTPYPELKPDDAFRIARALLQMASKEIPLNTMDEIEFAFGVSKIGRFRTHMYKQRGSLAIVVHRISLHSPTLADLGASDDAGRIAWGGPGLTIVTGQRKRLHLLAALTQDFNINFPGHLVSLEDPIEFLHRDRRAIVSQREIGVDTSSFIEGLKSVRRESPDAVIIHDMPNPETAEAALRYAEDGQNVVASIAGCRASEAARWFTRMFPVHREEEISERLCFALRGVIAESKDKVSVIPASRALLRAVLERAPLPLAA
ncbi:MAG: ATPase, T2SS/T4P/T4SS family [Myxococcota bacterium]